MLTDKELDAIKPHLSEANLGKATLENGVEVLCEQMKQLSLLAIEQADALGRELDEHGRRLTAALLIEAPDDLVVARVFQRSALRVPLRGLGERPDRGAQLAHADFFGAIASGRGS